MKLYLAGGESRHWLNLPLTEDNKNETVFSGRILQKYGKRNQADCMGGGFSEEIANDSILSRSNNGGNLWKEDKFRLIGGGTGSINENVPCKPAHDTEIQERAGFSNSPIRGGYP